MKKTGFLGTTYYIGKHFEIVNGVKTKHIFAGGMRIAQISGGTRYYHHKDHLGSTTGVTDDTGWLVWASDYEPYGLPRSAWWKTPSMDTLIRHRFTDQEYDAETRLYNYNARLYDPSIARFISPDTIVDNPYSSLALNRYMYVAGNPLRYTDPSGHWKIKIGGWKIRGDDKATLAAIAGVALLASGYGVFMAGDVLMGKAMMYGGVAAMGYAVDRAGGNVDARANASIDSNGNVSIGGSGGGGSGGSGGNGNSNWYATDQLILSQMQRAVEYAAKDARDREMYLLADIYDYVEPAINGVGSVCAFASMSPNPQVKAAATFGGFVAAGASVGRTIYNYSQNPGKMTKGELAAKITLDVAPMVGGRIAERVGSTAAEGIINVIDHQKGVFDTMKGIFYDQKGNGGK